MNETDKQHNTTQITSRWSTTRIKTVELLQPQVMHSNKKGDIYSLPKLNRVCGLPRDL